MKNLLKYATIFFLSIVGLIGLVALLDVCAEPTALSMERVNKANQKRLAEQPALNNSRSLAQLFDDK